MPDELFDTGIVMSGNDTGLVMVGERVLYQVLPLIESGIKAIGLKYLLQS